MVYYLSFFVLVNIHFVMSSVTKSKWFLFFIVFIAFLFSALRYDAGYDYFNYMGLIIDGNTVDFQRLELLNQYIILLARYFKSPQLYFSVTSFLYLLFMVLGLRNYKSFSITSLTILFLFIGFYLTSFDIIRQMVACAIVFYASSLIFKKKYIYSIIFFIVAYFFHKSALVSLLILILLKTAKKEFHVALYLSIFALAFFSTKILILLSEYFKLYAGYFASGGNDTGGKIYFLILFFLIAAYLFAKIIKTKNTTFWMSFNIFFVGILLYTALLPFGYFATRITYYFFPWIAIAFTKLYESSSKNKKAIYSFVYLISTFSYLVMLYVSSSNPRNPLLNYQFFFLN